MGNLSSLALTTRILFFTILLLTSGCSLLSADGATTAAPMTHPPAAIPIPTPTPTATPIPLIQFTPRYPSSALISEQDLELEFMFPLDELTPGVHVIYSDFAADPAIWIAPLDGSPARQWIVCRECPAQFGYLFSILIDGKKNLLTSRQYSLDANNTFIIDLVQQTGHWIRCQSAMENEICGFTPPALAGKWIPFYIGKPYGPYKDFYFSLTDGWYEIKSPLLSQSEKTLAFYSSDGRGALIVAPPRQCPDQSSLYFLSYEDQRLYDWSALPCQFEREDAIFAGWSPDGEQVAFVWREPETDSPDANHYLDAILVCPSSALVSGNVEECSLTASGLSSQETRIQLWSSIGFFGRDLGLIQWLDDTRFIWVKKPQVYDYTTWIGTIDLAGNIDFLYQGHNLGQLRLSPDGRYVLYVDETGDEWVYGVIDVEKGYRRVLDIPESSGDVNWLLLP